jgi:type II secretory pathway component GspD/PulD (secretin)
VLVNDGAMIVSGGLIEWQEDETHFNVPVLGDIPLIGRFFASEASKK